MKNPKPAKNLSKTRRVIPVPGSVLPRSASRMHQPGKFLFARNSYNGRVLQPMRERADAPPISNHWLNAATCSQHLRLCYKLSPMHILDVLETNRFDIIEHALKSREDVRHGLDEFGTLLRDAPNRLAASAKSMIPLVVSFYHEQAFHVLRLLINFCADHVDNRRYLLSEEPSLVAFWTEAFGTESKTAGVAGEPMLHYVMTLVNQFVRSVDENEEREFVEALWRKGAVDWTFTYHGALDATPDEMCGPMEFLVEYARFFPEHVTKTQFERVADGFVACRKATAYACAAECFLMHAQFLLSSTSVDDARKDFPVGRLREMLLELPVHDEQLAGVARKLFASCGNIYSWPAHDNWQDMERKVRDLASGQDAVVACAAVSLGNCVSSPETQAELAQRIGHVAPLAAVAQGLVRHAFHDVVYYQAYHFLNNAMTRDVARGLLVEANARAFYRNTKVVVDNFAYYPEVGHVYLKFLRKLVTLACLEGDADPMVFEAGWQYLLQCDASGEVVLLLLQAAAQRRGAKSAMQKQLLGCALGLGASVDIRTLLQKITAICVFLQNHGADEIRGMYGADGFASEFLPQLHAFLRQLEDALDQADGAEQSAAAHGALCNNSRYLALAAQRNLQAMLPPAGSPALAVCETAARMVARAKR
ncbi:hypothetical protein METBIDRAFT_9998 [Metschnikowia bicuspidata var. bicuspidata NRRL YB-4993]|uniref:Uncharacterized protein n=1 Tax=Metschnikowia bicuspidata var. bicuspidata NRRL YB-4993 TaxID=869754 RepID=A0A1A0HID8_9ASCO|nr:hypothetical protein METBIDRAFT_9998 [Metschnikowia bicuspidata var. bicuspidata NRRL YB-4993]OBA23770.1 hypothetical protein METBIDRAFT_9998 [Metschnikowia bicuspidata var. bicuspidata NRRL YB-4993]